MSTIIDLYMTLFGRTKIKDGTVIEMAEHGRAGGLSTGQPFKFTDSVDYALKMTEVGTDLYIAYANPGTAESSASWKAMKIDTSSGMRITFSDGNEKFDNVATDLTALSYS